jgi:hypothetical protein
MRGTCFYLGIDPGVSGGMALVTSLQECVWACSRAKLVKTRGLYNVWHSIKESHASFAALELVQGYMGGRSSRKGGDGEGDRASHSGKLMKTLGEYEGMLVAADISYCTPSPQEWLRVYGLRREGRGDTEWKNVLKAKAQSLFPKVKVTLAVSDALLIANYCRMRREG